VAAGRGPWTVQITLVCPSSMRDEPEEDVRMERSIRSLRRDFEFRVLLVLVLGMSSPEDLEFGFIMGMVWLLLLVLLLGDWIGVGV